MTILETITIKFSKDTYTMEISEGSLGTKYYGVFINGIFQKSYQRIPKDLSKFFNL